LEAISTDAATAECCGLPITHAGNGIVPNASICPGKDGYQSGKKKSFSARYFHVVFTLPHELNTVILNNKKVMLNILFKAVIENPSHLWRKQPGRKTGLYCHITYMESAT
jgi:hypothetical protein